MVGPATGNARPGPPGIPLLKTKNSPPLRHKIPENSRSSLTCIWFANSTEMGKRAYFGGRRGEGRGGATVLKVGGDKLCERSEQKFFFDLPLFGQWGDKILLT